MPDPIQAPAAPDLDTVLDVESGLEAPTVCALHLSGIYEVDPERSPEDQKTPRVETQFLLGTCTARSKLPAGCTDPREGLPTIWKFTFHFNVVTDRFNPKQVGVHGQMRGRVRRLAATFFRQLNARLPYHRLESMIEAGTTTGLINPEARSEDISRIEYIGSVSVRNTAWPAGT